MVGISSSSNGWHWRGFSCLVISWNPKQPFINGCFNWMIPNLYIGNGCFTKHLFINGCLGFQAIKSLGMVKSVFVVSFTYFSLVGGLKFQPISQIVVKLDHFPNFRGENKTCLKPAPGR